MIQYAEEKTTRVLPSFSVAGGEIKDLQVLPTQPAAHPPHHESASPAMSTIPISTTTTATSHYPQRKQQQHQKHNPHAHLQHEQHIHAPLVAPSPRQLPAHPQPNPPATPSVPYHDPAIISVRNTGSLSGRTHTTPCDMIHFKVLQNGEIRSAYITIAKQIMHIPLL